ncbi:MAG: ATP-dependent Clp protease proteolytic subunit, partial [uncultured Nocardioides sp.]
ELLHPAVGGAHVVRLPPHRPLRQALRGAHHLPRLPDLRRRGQRGHGAAAVPGDDEPRPGHQHLHQQPRRLVHRADGDLRHDALHQARRADGLPGPGGLRGRDPAGRRHPRQAPGAAQQPDPDPPALHRGHVRPDLRHRDPGQRDPPDARAAGEDDRRPQRQGDRPGQPRHRARQDPHRRAGRRLRPDRRRAGATLGRRGARL